MRLESFTAVILAAATAHASVQGFDISSYQTDVDFSAAYASGARFVIIKATEGTDYIDPEFSSHWTGATDAGFIRGGYHFAHPGETTGAAQAEYFAAHGGGWSGDGITLPGMLDLESESDGECWGLSAAAMVAWIQDFVTEYRAQTGRYCMLYTSPSWWESCTGNSDAFVDNNPLVLADYAASISSVPGGWPYQTVWQYADSYAYGGDADSFNGSEDDLVNLATGQ